MEEINIIKAKYEETRINILIAEVNYLLAYWTISKEYNDKFIKEYGEDFFDKTKEILIVKNLKNGTEERIEIEEPTNNYYIKFNYSDSIYQVELSRVGKEDDKDYGYKIISNKIQSPNIKVMLNDYDSKNIVFKNIKTNAKNTKTQYYNPLENSKEDVEKLYNDLIRPAWNAYKKENGYKEK